MSSRACYSVIKHQVKITKADSNSLIVTEGGAETRQLSSKRQLYLGRHYLLHKGEVSWKLWRGGFKLRRVWVPEPQ